MDMDYYYFPNSLCLNNKSFSKRIEKQTPYSLVYVVSCLTATTKDDQVLNILTLLASALPSRLINTIVVINVLAQSKWNKRQHLCTLQI